LEYQLTNQETSAVVYFDGACALCQAEISQYRKQDATGRITFVDVSPSDAEPSHDLTREQAMSRLHLFYSDGTMVTGASAFVGIWKMLPSWQWAARLASLSGATTFLEMCYRMFLSVRPILSRLVRLFLRKVSERTEG
jgi:predicted DCC family thiol-disulfide oxidoreductase YuxK